MTVTLPSSFPETVTFSCPEVTVPVVGGVPAVAKSVDGVSGIVSISFSIPSPSMSSLGGTVPPPPPPEPVVPVRIKGILKLVFSTQVAPPS